MKVFYDTDAFVNSSLNILEDMLDGAMLQKTRAVGREGQKTPYLDVASISIDENSVYHTKIKKDK